MFMGEYDHSIDPKNRVIIPVKFRSELGPSFVVTIGAEGCLYLCTMERWEEFAANLRNMPFTKTSRQTQRYFFQNAAECELDKQGRILIPEKLKAKAGLDKDVVIVGNNDRVEIWNPDKLYDQDVTDPEEMVDMLSDEYGLRF